MEDNDSIEEPLWMKLSPLTIELIKKAKDEKLV